MFGLLEDAIEEPPDRVHPVVIRPASADAAVGTGLVAVGRHVAARTVVVVAGDAVDEAFASAPVAEQLGHPPTVEVVALVEQRDGHVEWVACDDERYVARWLSTGSEFELFDIGARILP
jgi:hypothetical protein